MQIIIVGAGIAGLCLAIALSKSNHKVLVLESAPQLAEIGAGVQTTPQAIKYLFSWGLKDDLLAECITPEKILFKDWKDSAAIGALDMTSFEEEYGAPYIVIHRASLHSILHRHAVQAGAKIRLDATISKYDFDNGSVELKDGEILKADLVVGADGINSFARSQLLGSSDPGTQPTGWAALRMMAEISKIKANPLTADLVDLNTYNSNFWIAPDTSCMTYWIKDASMLNIVLSHRDNIDMRHFSYEQHKQVVDNLFGQYDLPVRHLLDLALPKITNYPVYAVPPLSHWIHPSGRFTLVGDAAHAMAFYMSMGVSLAVEDAVSLASVLDLTCESDTGPAGLKDALGVFEKVRKRRAETVQKASLRAGDSYHVPNGKEREAMYKLMSRPNEDVESGMSESSKVEDGTGCSIHKTVGGLANKRTRDWCYGYDAVGDVLGCFGEKM
ncbi:salicylate hydroxylase [Penicillium longicatenatum]|uniref:salicylate hydroxylase n=1 Tax=Penicillium longicatenatum TaxID=1561947 RepID=UPI002546AEFC|nr:salicylate hydroxylase [Penicillium longicatenatum]KAJ5630445.1 salicylate hydroxylase [Penicillium longicatenatum]